MRVLIVLPRQAAATGNEVSAARHRDGLVGRGHQVELARVHVEDAGRLRDLSAAFSPDLAHLLHAYRAGQPWLAAGLADQVPFAVTLTGTDVHGGMAHPDQGPPIRAVLARAGAVITQNPLTAAALRADAPELAARVHYLAPGVVLGKAACPSLRAGWAAEGVPLLLHPAGIRPVKRNRELLELLAPLAAGGLRFAAGFCGPVLDPDYGKSFFRALERFPWARYLGVVEPPAMAAALAQADVVLNHSRSEGLSNALAEAAVLGRPILAVDVPGNAAVVEPGSNGLLYRDERAFREHAAALIRDPELRRNLSRAHPERFDPAREARELEGIYEELLA